MDKNPQEITKYNFIVNSVRRAIECNNPEIKNKKPKVVGPVSKIKIPLLIAEDLRYRDSQGFVDDSMSLRRSRREQSEN